MRSIQTTTDRPASIRRGDATVTTFSDWQVADATRQHAAVDAAIDAWADAGWPDGLLSHTSMASEDGTTIRHHAQWRTADAFSAVTARSATRFGAIAVQAGTTIERRDLSTYDPPRSIGPLVPPPDVGCVVIVDVALDAPDRALQHRWIDTVLAALDHQAPVGLVAAHLHPSTDGARVVNLAWWTDAEAHRAALRSGGGVGGEHPAWRRVREHPGISPLGGVARFGHVRTVESDR